MNIRIRWIKMARAVAGLATVGVLLAHFVHPALPLELWRIQFLVLLLAALLGLDIAVDRTGIDFTPEENDDDRA